MQYADAPSHSYSVTAGAEWWDSCTVMYSYQLGYLPPDGNKVFKIPITAWLLVPVCY